MLLENVHKEDIMKRTAQMCKDNIVNVLLLLLFYHLSLIAGSMPAGVGSMERAFRLSPHISLVRTVSRGHHSCRKSSWFCWAQFLSSKTRALFKS